MINTQRFSLLALGMAVGLPGILLGFQRGQREMTADERVHQLDALVNVRQLAAALNVYASDFDDVFPNVHDVKTLKVVTYPYVRSKDNWKTANVGAEIRFNNALGGVSRKGMKDLGSDVAFYESKPWPDGRRAISFADGSGKLLPAHEWAQVALSLLLNLPKVAKPLPDSVGRTWKD